QKYFYADRTRIMRSDKTGALETTKDLDRSCSNLQVRGVGLTGDPYLMFEVEDKGYHRIYAMDAVYDKGFGPVTSGYSDTGLSAKGFAETFLRSDFSTPSQLWYGGGIGIDGKVNRLDHFNDDLVKQWNLGPVKNITYKGADNEDVQMWIVY